MTDRRGVLVVGATGRIGRAIVSGLSRRWQITGTHHRHPSGDSIAFDLAADDPASLPIAWAEHRAVIVAGAITSLHRCRREPQLARRVNVDGTRRLIEHAAQTGVLPIFLSSDAASSEPTTEYGRQKLEVERAMPAGGLVLRLTKVSDGFVEGVASRLRAGETVRAATDQRLSLLAAGDVARVLDWALERDLSGLHELAAPPVRSRYQWCAAIAEATGANPALIEACSIADIDPGLPRDCSLDGGPLARQLPFELEGGDAQVTRVALAID